MHVRELAPGCREVDDHHQPSNMWQHSLVGLHQALPSTTEASRLPPSLAGLHRAWQVRAWPTVCPQRFLKNNM